MNENDLSIDAIIDHSNNNRHSFNDDIVFRFDGNGNDEQIECYVIDSYNCCTESHISSCQCSAKIEECYSSYFLQIDEYKKNILTNTSFVDLGTNEYFDRLARVMVYNDKILVVIFLNQLHAQYDMTIVFVDVYTKITYRKIIEFVDPSFRYDYVFFVNEQVNSENKTLEEFKKIYKTGSTDVLQLIAKYIGVRMEIVSSR